MSNRTRQVEMLVAATHGDSHGEWWTEYVRIPIDTDEDDLESVARAVWFQAFEKDKRQEAIAGVMLYDAPELTDEDYRYRVLRDLEVPQDSDTDPRLLPAGTVVIEALEQNGGKTVLVEYYPEGIFDPRAPYLYDLKKEDLEEIENG